MLSTATFPQAKCLLASKDVSDGTVISPDLKNPKKQSEATAHSIIMSASALWESSAPSASTELLVLLVDALWSLFVGLHVFFGFLTAPVRGVALRKILKALGGLR